MIHAKKEDISAINQRFFLTRSLDISTINLEVIHDKITILSAINPSQIVIDKSGDFTT
ncbi:Uncharacterized protein APZ42_029074 [Daphnia magna]|uniref:Uncharacterized protein n=1 Tax=Daphnia magna TaxID=35525 RepID=A0A164PY24_9CRUS|nr:Uncharacterized protein APZ42_029074 [Daphnia magna]